MMAVASNGAAPFFLVRTMQLSMVAVVDGVRRSLTGDDFQGPGS